MSRALRFTRAFSTLHNIPSTSQLILKAPQQLHSRVPACPPRRTLATHAAERPPARPAQLVRHPSQDDLDAADVYADLIAPSDARLALTDRAAEQLQRIAAREKNDESALRVAVDSGGCHGYQYKMELAKSAGPDDYVFAHPSISPARIVVDAVSLAMLKGATVDFATELIGSSFRVLDNPQAKGAGCGCGVSWEAKV